MIKELLGHAGPTQPASPAQAVAGQGTATVGGNAARPAAEVMGWQGQPGTRLFSRPIFREQSNALDRALH